MAGTLIITETAQTGEQFLLEVRDGGGEEESDKLGLGNVQFKVLKRCAGRHVHLPRITKTII